MTDIMDGKVRNLLRKSLRVNNELGYKVFLRSPAAILYSIESLEHKLRFDLQNRQGAPLPILDRRQIDTMDTTLKKVKHELNVTPQIDTHQPVVEDDIDNYLAATHDLITISTINESKRSAEYESYSSHRRWMDDVWKVANPKSRQDDDLRLTTAASLSASLSDLDERVKVVIANMFDNMINHIKIDRFGHNVYPAFELLSAFVEELEKDSYSTVAMQIKNANQVNESRSLQTVHQFHPEMQYEGTAYLKDIFRLIRDLARENTEDPVNLGHFFPFAVRGAHSIANASGIPGGELEVALRLLEYKANKFLDEQKRLGKSISTKGMGRLDAVSADSRISAQTRQATEIIEGGFRDRYSHFDDREWMVIFYCLRANNLAAAYSKVKNIHQQLQQQRGSFHQTNVGAANNDHVDYLAQLIDFYNKIQEYQTAYQSTGNAQGAGPQFPNFADFPTCIDRCSTHLHNTLQQDPRDPLRVKPFEWMCYNLVCLGLLDQEHNCYSQGRYLPTDQWDGRGTIDYDADDYQWHMLWFQYYLGKLHEMAQQPGNCAHPLKQNISTCFAYITDHSLYKCYIEEFKGIEMDGTSVNSLEKAYTLMVCQDFYGAIDELTNNNTSRGFPTLAILLQNLCMYYSLIIPGGTTVNPVYRYQPLANYLPQSTENKAIKQFLLHGKKGGKAIREFYIEIGSFSLAFIDPGNHQSFNNPPGTFGKTHFINLIKVATDEFDKSGHGLLKEYLEFYKWMYQPGSDPNVKDDHIWKYSIPHTTKQLLEKCFSSATKQSSYKAILMNLASDAPDSVVYDRVFYLNLFINRANSSSSLDEFIFKTICDRLEKLTIKIGKEFSSGISNISKSNRKNQFGNAEREEHKYILNIQAELVKQDRKVQSSTANVFYDVELYVSKFQLLVELFEFLDTKVSSVSSERYKSCIVSDLINSMESTIQLMTYKRPVIAVSDDPTSKQTNKAYSKHHTIFEILKTEYDVHEASEQAQFKEIIFYLFDGMYKILHHMKSSDAIKQQGISGSDHSSLKNIVEFLKVRIEKEAEQTRSLAAQYTPLKELIKHFKLEL